MDFEKAITLIPCSLTPLLPGVAQLVHVFDGGFVDHGLGASADLENVPVVPLDAAFEHLSVIKHENHGGLRLNLFLQIEEFGVPQRRLMFMAMDQQVEWRVAGGSSAAAARLGAGALDGGLLTGAIQRMFRVPWQSRFSAHELEVLRGRVNSLAVDSLSALMEMKPAGCSDFQLQFAGWG